MRKNMIRSEALYDVLVAAGLLDPSPGRTRRIEIVAEAGQPLQMTVTRYEDEGLVTTLAGFLTGTILEAERVSGPDSRSLDVAETQTAAAASGSGH